MSERIVGVLSDTHGLVRPGLVEAMGQVHSFIHAGDVGNRQVLDELSRIAPVIAVRGNVDQGDWARLLPESMTFGIDGVLIHVIHDLSRIAVDPVTQGLSVVIFGHSHRPSIKWSGGVLYLNPGSAGPPRFGLAASMARLRIRQGQVEAELLDVSG